MLGILVAASVKFALISSAILLGHLHKKNLRFQIAAKLVDLLCNLAPNYSDEVMMILSSRFTFRTEFGENSYVRKKPKKWHIVHFDF